MNRMQAAVSATISRINPVVVVVDGTTYTGDRGPAALDLGLRLEGGGTVKKKDCLVLITRQQMEDEPRQGVVVTVTENGVVDTYELAGVESDELVWTLDLAEPGTR